MNENNIFLSVVIPAYNEAKRIIATLPLIDDYLTRRGFKYEIVAVDDGSKDNTISVIESFIRGRDNMRLLKNGENRGKGYTVKKGALEANGEYILFTDADLATPIEEFEKLFRWIKEGYDMAIGSRRMKDSNVFIPKAARFRKLIAWIGYCTILFFGLKHKIKDTQCGFKCFRKDMARHIFSKQRLDGGMFDVEIMHIAVKNNFHIKEVPVTWRHKEGSTINILKCMLFDPIDLLKIRLNSFLGRY